MKSLQRSGVRSSCSPGTDDRSKNDTRQMELIEIPKIVKIVKIDGKTAAILDLPILGESGSIQLLSQDEIADIKRKAMWSLVHALQESACELKGDQIHIAEQVIMRTKK